MAVALQSSTAVTLITSSFASKGLLTTVSGIAVVLGADIGTTLAAQILIFDLSWLVPVLLTAGYIISRLKAFDDRYKHVGHAMLGVGLVLLSLKLVIEASAPFQESDLLQRLIVPLGNEPALALILGALLTWAMHSSLASVLLFASFVGSGIIPLSLGVLLVLGANLGGTLIAYGDTLGENPIGRRIPVANMIIRGAGILMVLPFISYTIPYLSVLSDDAARTIVNFHTGFNLALAIVFLPFIGLIDKLATKLIPNRKQKSSKLSPKFLDYTALDHPTSALLSAERETLRISDLIGKMLEDTIEVFRTDNKRLARKVMKCDNDVDRIYSAVKKYLAKITLESLSEQESQKHMHILTFATNLEHIGDIIDKSLIELAEKKIRKQAHFSKEGFAEIQEAYTLLIENLKLAQHVFMSDDLQMARQLFQGKQVLKDMEIKSAERHMRRLSEGISATHRTSSIHLDLFRDMRRIQSYLSVVAYKTLEEADELHETRLKTADV